MTCRPIRQGPNTFSPPTGVTCQDVPLWVPTPTAAPAGSALAGRSVTRRSSSARVRAELACSIRWLNSSSVSRPSPVAWLSRSTVASRSASDARTPSPGPPLLTCAPASGGVLVRDHNNRRAPRGRKLDAGRCGWARPSSTWPRSLATCGMPSSRRTTWTRRDEPNHAGPPIHRQSPRSRLRWSSMYSASS